MNHVIILTCELRYPSFTWHNSVSGFQFALCSNNTTANYYIIWQIIRHHAFNQIWSKIRPREQLQKELIIHEDASNVEIELIVEMYCSRDGTNPNVKSIAFLKNNHWYKTSKWKFTCKIRLKVTVLRPLLFSVQCWAKEPQTQSKNCIRWKTISLVLRLSWSTEITRLQIENQLTVRLIIEVT